MEMPSFSYGTISRAERRSGLQPVRAVQDHGAAPKLARLSGADGSLAAVPDGGQGGQPGGVGVAQGPALAVRLFRGGAHALPRAGPGVAWRPDGAKGKNEIEAVRIGPPGIVRTGAPGLEKRSDPAPDPVDDHLRSIPAPETPPETGNRDCAKINRGSGDFAFLTSQSSLSMINVCAKRRLVSWLCSKIQFRRASHGNDAGGKTDRQA